MQVPSNSPYAHWTWQMPSAMTYPNHDCVLAYQQYQYAQYSGDHSLAQVQDRSKYQVRGRGRGASRQAGQ